MMTIHYDGERPPEKNFPPLEIELGTEDRLMHELPIS